MHEGGGFRFMSLSGSNRVNVSTGETKAEDRVSEGKGLSQCAADFFMGRNLR